MHDVEVGGKARRPSRYWFVHLAESASKALGLQHRLNKRGAKGLCTRVSLLLCFVGIRGGRTRASSRSARGARVRAWGGGRGLCCGPGDDSFGGGARGFYLERPGLLNLNPAHTLSCLWLLFIFLCLDALAFCGCSEVSSYLVAFATPVSAMDEMEGEVGWLPSRRCDLSSIFSVFFPASFWVAEGPLFRASIVPDGTGSFESGSTCFVGGSGDCCGRRSLLRRVASFSGVGF